MYWFLVLGEIENILNIQLDFDPVSLVLGRPNRRIATSANRTFYNILSFAAKSFCSESMEINRKVFN